MKNTIKLTTIIITIFLSLTIGAQAPEKLSYQAIVRDASSQLVTNTNIGMQISVLQGSVSGTVVYAETQSPTTNINGLVSIEIGTGNVVSGNFGTIDWANGPYFIKTESDLAGGTNYTITGTSQLLSVPYALHANTASALAGGNPSTILSYAIYVYNVVPARYLGAGSSSTTYEEQLYMPLHKDGTLKNLRILMHYNPIDTGGQIDVTVRINGVDTALALSFDDSDTIGTIKIDTDTVAVSEGDLLTIRYSSPTDPGVGTALNVILEYE